MSTDSDTNKVRHKGHNWGPVFKKQTCPRTRHVRLIKRKNNPENQTSRRSRHVHGHVCFLWTELVKKPTRSRHVHGHVCNQGHVLFLVIFDRTSNQPKNKARALRGGQGNLFLIKKARSAIKMDISAF